MANPVAAPTVNPFDASLAVMQKTMEQQIAFNAANQQISAAMTASSAATNLVTSSHQAAGNAAKSVGQNMVDSSRR